MIVPTYSFQYADYEALVRGANGNGKILFFGNSVIRHSSKCDVDHRSIAEMYADSTHLSVIDMSRGGMPIGRMLDLAEILVNLGLKPKSIYFQVTFDGDFVRQVNDESGILNFYHSNISQFIHKVNVCTKAELESNKRVEFNGKYYGGYAEFSKNYFVIEKSRMSCPENVGFDRDFVTFMYWRNFLDKPSYFVNPLYFDRLKRLESKGVNVVFWVTPLNLKDISDLLGDDSANELVTYKNKMIDSMSNFNVIDMAADFPPESFADRWCACGHLNEHGRLRVVSKLISSMKNSNDR